jgi:hypothetical protein
MRRVGEKVVFISASLCEISAISAFGFFLDRAEAIGKQVGSSGLQASWNC